MRSFLKNIIPALMVLAVSAPAVAQTSWTRQGDDAPAAAQTAEERRIAQEMQAQFLASGPAYAKIALTAAMAEPVGGRENVDQRRDPWRPVTQQQMLAATQDPIFKVPNYSLQVQVDFNRDGQMDVARMYNNSRQGAIIVAYGGLNRSEVIYKTNEPFSSGQQIIAAGRNKIVLNFPEARSVVLVQEGGAAKAYSIGN